MVMMKKILYITASDPLDPTSGSRQRSAFLLEALKEIGEVEIVNPLAYGDGSTMRKLLAVPFRKITKVGRWPFRSRLLDGKYDLVVARYVMAAAEMQAWQYGPCYIDIDDLPIDAFDQVDKFRLPPWLRPFSRALVKAWQDYCLSKCAGVWVISQEQTTKVHHKNMGVLPNLARRPKVGYRVSEVQKRQLMTIGLMGYGPNSAGVDWFIDTIWPKVHSTYPDLTYVIAGGELSEVLKKKWDAIPGVRVLGFVDDIDALYAESLAVVAPINAGAGTCIKVVEAGLHGRYVFATPVACRGHEQLMEIGGIKVFEDADCFMSALQAFMSVDRTALQQRIADKTCEINSVASFAKEVKRVAG